MPTFRAYGYFQVVWAVGSVALFAIGGEVTAAYAHRGILTLIAGVTLALAPLLFLIPDDRAEVGDNPAAGPRASPVLGAMTFAAILLYLTVSAAVYAFYAPLGERAGLDTGAVGYTLTVATLFGLLGAGAATVINLRLGRAIPISGFCVGFAVLTLVICLTYDPVTYVIAAVGSVIIYYFSIPYLFGLAAAIDRSGRWAVAAGSAYLLGFAAGPLFGGVVITASGYTGLALICAAITLVAWALAMAVIRSHGTAPAAAV